MDAFGELRVWGVKLGNFFDINVYYHALYKTGFQQEATGIVRDGSRLNQVMLTRLDPAELDEMTLSRAAEGVVAYSTACTHDGCPVTSWDRKTMQYVCPCHQSRFDPKAGGVLISGPAYRPLPALPLMVQDGVLVVADVLTARPGGGR